MLKIIDEVKQITADQVAKKQDAAKLNFPAIIKKIKDQAELGVSRAILSLNEMNEYDKALLEKEGFSVWLIDIQKDLYDKPQYLQFPQREDKKQWEVRW